MKVLLTVHQFFPEFTSGTEVLTLSVARELLRRGHEVCVYTAHPSDKSMLDDERFDEYVFEGIHVYRFHHAYVPMGGQVSMIEVGYDNRLAADRFEKILQSFKPEIVHFFHLNRLGTRLIEKVNLANIPAFMTLTDFWSVCPTGQLLLPDGKLCEGPNRYGGNCIKHFAQSAQQNNISKWIPVAFVSFLSRITCYGFLPTYPQHAEVIAMGDRLGVNIARLNQLKKILAPTKLMQDVLVNHGVNPGLIVESAFGIDIQGEEAECRTPRKPLQIGYIGTLGFHKGCHVLIEAFKALPQYQAVLKIFGNQEDFPEYFKELITMADGYSTIEFCGTFPNANIAKVLHEFDVLVVPSIWYENTPLVIYSAQAAHCPVVASDLKGISAVIRDEENGLLFEPGCAADLARKLLRLIEEPELISRLSANANQPKSISTYVDELLEIWMSV